jgi:hypothetical protein
MTPATTFTEIILKPDSDLQQELFRERIEQNEADQTIEELINSQTELL